MQLSNAVRQRIINIGKKEHVNLKEISKKADLKYSTLESFMKGKTRIITVETLFKICDGNIITNWPIYGYKHEIVPKEFFDDKLFIDVVDEYEKQSIK